MDKHSSPSNEQKSCCEKLFVAVRTTSPFIRPIRLTKQQHRQDAASHTPASSAKVSLVTPTPLKDRCVRVPKVETVTVEPSKAKERSPRVSKQSVGPPAADTKTQAEAAAVVQNHKGNHSHQFHVPSTTVNHQAKPNKATMLPIHGDDNKFPTHVGDKINDISTKYIERAGKDIRSPTNVGVPNPGNKQDSFNDRVNDFIGRTKEKFNAPSFVVSEGKEKRRVPEKNLVRGR